MATQEPRTDVDGIDDPDDYKQRRRIQEILDARQEALEARSRAFDALADPAVPVDESLVRKIVREGVEHYLLESEMVLRDQCPDQLSDDVSRQAEIAYHVAYEAELGTLEMRSKTVEFTGVFDLLDAPEEFVDRWEEQDTSHIRAGSTTTHEQRHQVPLHVSKRALRAMNRFWSEMGLTLEYDNGMPTDRL